VFNPNAHIYRADIFTAINDCLLRARGRSKFATFMDLDEFLAVNETSNSENDIEMSTLSVINLLNELATEYPNAGLNNVCATFVKYSGGFEFQSKFTQETIPNEQVWHSLDDANFESLRVLQRDEKVNSLIKLIVRPERVERIHVHEVLNYVVRTKTETHIINLK
jgi:hypothetical protein